jgi:hypothetical protein
MNPLNCIWHPEVLVCTNHFFITTPPLGKPDPRLKRIPDYVRARVYQKAQVGPTCMYYAARRISPHYGKKDDSFSRINEIMLSRFRKYLSSIHVLEAMPLAEEQKTFLMTYFISYLGMHLHFPFETLLMNMFMWQAFLMPRTQELSHEMPTQIDPAAVKYMWDSFQRKLKCMTAYSLKLMLHRMQINPLKWIPRDGPFKLIKALKVHLYLFCMGDFGAHVFYYQNIVGYHPKLGPIFSGPLKPCGRNLAKFFSMHAILVIGVRARGFMKGDVYYIDPNDPSGPGLLQKVYVISLKDFFYRIKDSAGCGDLHSMTSEFIWGGDPKLFLA